MDISAFQIVERRCSICMSPLRERVDAMLLGHELTPEGEPYRLADIASWASERGGALSRSSLSRHNTNHVQPGMRAFLETQANLDALEKATGRKLSLPGVFSNILLDKAIRLLNDTDEAFWEAVGADPKLVIKLLEKANQAARNVTHIQKTEAALSREQKQAVAKEVGEKLERKGLTTDTIRLIEREILGMG